MRESHQCVRQNVLLRQRQAELVLYLVLFLLLELGELGVEFRSLRNTKSPQKRQHNTTTNHRSSNKLDLSSICLGIVDRRE
jgi:hypothetical protein